MAATLDARDARPLTSREISKVLCSILTGVLEVKPDERTWFDDVVRTTRFAVVGDTPLAKFAYPPPHGASPTWAVALAATVVGFRSWCSKRDIETALAWLAENMSLLYPVPISKEN